MGRTPDTVQRPDNTFRTVMERPSRRHASGVRIFTKPIRQPNRKITKYQDNALKILANLQYLFGQVRYVLLISRQESKAVTVGTAVATVPQRPGRPLPIA
jgi:hypothetical protein